MSYSELLGWKDYLSNNPTIQEMQMALLLHMQAGKLGVNANLEDFIYSKPTKTTSELTEDIINEIAGVNNE